MTTLRMLLLSMGHVVSKLDGCEHKVELATAGLALLANKELAAMPSMPVSLPAPRGLGSSRRVVLAARNTPLEFWSVYPLDVVNVCQFQGPSKHPVVYEPVLGNFFPQKTHPWILGTRILWILSISGDFAIIRAGGACCQGWRNLLRVPGGTSWGHLISSDSN